MRYTRTYNKSATTMVIASIQILSSTSWSPFKVACGHTISQTEQLVMLTTEAAEIWMASVLLSEGLWQNKWNCHTAIFLAI